MPDPTPTSQPSTSQPSTAPQKLVLRVDPLAYLGIFLFLICVLVLASPHMAYLGWLLIFPVIAVVWVARVRTEITPQAVKVRRLIGGRTLAWDQIAGFEFRKYSTRAALTDGSSLTLPAVTFRRLPLVSIASGGRIPDPTPPHAPDDTAATTTSGPKAADAPGPNTPRDTASRDDTDPRNTASQGADTRPVNQQAANRQTVDRPADTEK